METDLLADATVWDLVAPDERAGAAFYFAQNHDKTGLAIAAGGGGLLVRGVITLAF